MRATHLLRLLSLFIILVTLVIASKQEKSAGETIAGDKLLDDQFRDFKRSYHRTYSTKEEEARRREIFRKNMFRFWMLRRENPKLKIEINSLADQTDEEVRLERLMCGSEVPFCY